MCYVTSTSPRTTTFGLVGPLLRSCKRSKINPNHVSYKTKLVDGTEVVQEVHAKPKSNQGQTSTFANDHEVNGNKPGLEGPSIGHIDWISSLTLCLSQPNRWYVVTGAKDGVIKVWK